MAGLALRLEDRRDSHRRQNGSPKDAPPLGTMRAGALIDQARLADPGTLPTSATTRPLPMRARSNAWCTASSSSVAPHKARQPARRSRLQARPHRPGSQHLIDLQRRAHALHRHCSQRLDLYVAFRQSQHCWRDPESTPASPVVSCAPPRASSGPSPSSPCGGRYRWTAHKPSSECSPTQIYTRRHARGAPPRYNGGRLPACQGRIAGAHRVIFMGDRCPEQGHDAVAHDLVDGSLVAVHGRPSCAPAPGPAAGGLPPDRGRPAAPWSL